MIFTSCLITLILLIWFKTEAFIVYSKIFKLDECFYIKEWEIFKNTKDCTVTYLQYLRIKFPNGFLTKLITCPICFSVWLTIFSTVFIGFTNFPITCVLSIIMYYVITKLM